MSDIQYNNPEGEDGLYVFPHVELKYRREKLPKGTIYQLNLPPHLCGLESPTQNESIGILRYLALRLARLLSGYSDEIVWYNLWKEETVLYDYLEIATAILAALEIEVISTTELGHVAVELNPIVENIEEFFTEEFIPLWHYMNTVNKDDDEVEQDEDEFEYDFSDAVFTVKELNSLYSFNFLRSYTRAVNLDIIRNLAGDDEDPILVMGKISENQSSISSREFSQPLERILMCIMEVIYFFKNSGEIADSNDFEMDDSEMTSDDFLSEAVIFESLSISDVSITEQGTYRAVLRPGDSPTDFAEHVGFTFDDPFEETDPVDLITLGYYEYHFFTPDEPVELH